MAEEKDYFLVCSQGNAGSIWLAWALDLHPGITCSMGVDHPFMSTYDPESGMSLESLATLWSTRISCFDDVAMGVMQNDGRAIGLVQGLLDQKGIPGVVPARKPPLTPDELFAELGRFFESPIYGNIHGLTIHNMFHMRAAKKFRGRPIVANLIRHPIARFQALIGRKIDLMAANSPLNTDIDIVVESNRPLMNYLSSRHDLDLEDARSRYIIWTLKEQNTIGGWTKELTDFPEVLHITMEKLMADECYFRSITSILTKGNIIPDQGYLNIVFSGRKVVGRAHPHQRGVPSKSAEAAFSAWPKWLQEMMAMEVEAHDVARVHAPFGYDFSFL